MFSRRVRLSRAEFATLSRDRSAKRVTTAHFSAVSTIGTPNAGAAVVISKKVEKSSVRRHLLKRRIMAASAPHIVSTQAVIVYAREGSNSLSYPELSHELETLFKRLSPNPSL